MSGTEIKKWAQCVLAQVRRIADLRNDWFIFLAGKKYGEYLVPEIEKYEVPFEGLRIGEQLRRFKEISVQQIESRRRGAGAVAVESLNRLRHLDRFYEILQELGQKLCGKKLLRGCHAKMGWPRRGIYFFFEEGEYRRNSGTPRVVRIGTHGVSKNAKSTLWSRLRAHKGREKGSNVGGGNHRGSIFRLHVGTAIMNLENLSVDSWGKKVSDGAEVRAREHFLEIRVSDRIRVMPFLFVAADDDPGKTSVRKYIEKNSIALLSNFKKEAIDSPSIGWLGQYCSNEKVRKSGLWNVDHVDEAYDPGFLDALALLTNGGKPLRF